MRSIRIRILAIIAVLAIVGFGGWQLLPSDEVDEDPIKVGTSDEVTSLDPVAPTTPVPGPSTATCTSRC